MHPQIAAFPRLGLDNTPPVRALEGQKTLISRTMHGFAYDEPRDEIIVTSPLVQAVLVFRGGANGEEPPIRVIQGPHTQLRGNTDRLEVDPVNNEIYVPLRNAILVFPREGNGDVAPVRVIKGPDTMLKRAGSVAVDPVNNVIAVGLSGGEGEGATTEDVLVESD